MRPSVTALIHRPLFSDTSVSGKASSMQDVKDRPDRKASIENAVFFMLFKCYIAVPAIFPLAVIINYKIEYK